MKSVYALLNAGIANARHSLDHYHHVNESGMDQYGRKVAVMDPDEYNQQMNSLNSNIASMKRAIRILETHEMRKTNQIWIFKTRFLMCVLFIITFTVTTYLIKMGLL